MQIFPNGTMRYYDPNVVVPEEPLELTEPLSVTLQQGRNNPMTLHLTSLTMTSGEQPTEAHDVDLDEEGLPIPVPERQMSEVRCTITTAMEHSRGRYEDGKYRACSYSVTLNSEDVAEDFNPTAVVLTHDKKGVLGTFQVQRVEYYDITQTIEIWV